MTNRDDKAFSFEVDESSDLPLWVQLKNRLAYLITSGYYAQGDQLPTVRALASDISVNYNTVNKAYLALKSEGYIESTRGRGVFVRKLDVDVDEEISAAVDTVVDDCIAACRELGLSLDDIGSCVIAKIQQAKAGEGQEPGEAPAGRIVTIRLGAPAMRKRA